LGIGSVRRHISFYLQVLQRHAAAHSLFRTPLWLKENAEMTLQIGDLAPDFTAESATGELRFHEWLGESWGILFSHPADFTPVCTTELGAAARLEPEFARRDTKIAAVSVDSAKDHRTWAKDIAETQGAQVNFPMIADSDRSVADLYGMIHPNASDTATVRTVFVIGPDKKIKLTMTYPASTGRNFAEILRVLDSLQLTAQHQLATPADWQQGQEVVITPAVSDEEAAIRFPGYRTVKPYLRLTDQP
jgi:alkyl hydroperoxide reductase subunit AhpC